MMAYLFKAQARSEQPKQRNALLDTDCESPPSIPRASFLMLLIACAAIFFGCDARSALDKKLLGQWRRGSLEFVFQSGTISTRRTGHVYATYEVLDQQTIRFRRDDRDSPIDLIVKVSFPDSNRMLWQRRRGEEFIDWWSFERVAAAR